MKSYDKGLFEKILNQILSVSDKIGKEHPWQLIYMNLYKIAKHYQMADKQKILRKKVRSAVADPFFTIDMININFELQCMEDVQSFSFGDKIGEWVEKNAKKNEDSCVADNHNRYMYIRYMYIKGGAANSSGCTAFLMLRLKIVLLIIIAASSAIPHET